MDSNYDNNSSEYPSLKVNIDFCIYNYFLPRRLNNKLMPIWQKKKCWNQNSTSLSTYFKRWNM